MASRTPFSAVEPGTPLSFVEFRPHGPDGASTDTVFVKISDQGFLSVTGFVPAEVPTNQVLVEIADLDLPVLSENTTPRSGGGNRGAYERAVLGLLLEFAGTGFGYKLLSVEAEAKIGFLDQGKGLFNEVLREFVDRGLVAQSKLSENAALGLDREGFTVRPVNKLPEPSSKPAPEPPAGLKSQEFAITGLGAAAFLREQLAAAADRPAESKTEA